MLFVSGLLTQVLARRPRQSFTPNPACGAPGPWTEAEEPAPSRAAKSLATKMNRS